MAIDLLASAIEASFDAPGDRIEWNLTSAQAPRSDGQQLRVDAQHELGAPAGQFHEVDASRAEQQRTRPWLVLVECASEVRQGKHAGRLRSAIEHDAQLLIVVCNVEPSTNALESTRDLDPAARIAQRLRCDFVGPLCTGSTRELTETLDRLKQAGRSAVVYLDARQSSTPPPHFQPLDRPGGSDTRPAGEGEPLRQIAAETLLRLAEGDRRVAAFSTDVDPLLPTAWESRPDEELAVEARVPFALNHCAALAARGGKPFLFLSVDEAQNFLGCLRREICLDRRGVTLVVEARRPGGTSEGIGSASLAGLRHLPDVSLLSPKDGTELCQMLRWCVQQSDPAIVWLPEQWEPPVSWPQGGEISLGRAERLGPGVDVAIIAWGPQAAAAAIAAENLAQRGIGATVVNARFAQPLDIDLLTRACGDCAYVVLVDDAPEGGGFASWVAEHLLRKRIVQSLTIVTREAALASTPCDDPHHHTATAIVERCRWLGEPIAGRRIETKLAVAPSFRGPGAFETTCPAVSARDAAAEASLQRQVLAQQFSPFIQQRVDQYARMGSRDVYLWRWCLHGLGLTTLSCVAPELRQDLCDTKLLAVMYGVMLDDVADQRGSDDFLAALIGIIAGRPERDFAAFTRQQQQYARFTCDLWDTFRDRLQCSPCYQEYAELLDYDHRQILNTFAYSCMVNKQPTLLNVQEHDMYLPHNMQMMSFATMDLMCSPGFGRDELGKLREVIWHAQSMGRIGNLVSTWQREIADRDFTSGVFARALRQGDLTPEDLRSAAGPYIEAAIRRGEHEQYFLRKWESHWQCIEALAAGIRSVDVVELLGALAQLMRMELLSRGLK